MNHLEERDFEKFTEGKVDTLTDLVAKEGHPEENLDSDSDEDEDSDSDEESDDESDDFDRQTKQTGFSVSSQPCIVIHNSPVG